MVTAFNPGYSATEAGRLQVQDQPQQLKRELCLKSKGKRGLHIQLNGECLPTTHKTPARFNPKFKTRRKQVQFCSFCFLG